MSEEIDVEKAMEQSQKIFKNLELLLENGFSENGVNQARHHLALVEALDTLSTQAIKIGKILVDDNLNREDKLDSIGVLIALQNMYAERARDLLPTKSEGVDVE